MFGFSAVRAVGACLFIAATTLAFPTWPDKNDQLEQTVFLTNGYGKRAFLDFISPCSFSDIGNGRINAAEWIRTAYHDMATADVIAGTGGIDASLLFETDRAENIGPAINHTFGFLSAFHSSQTSVSDLLALAVYAAVGNCGGPLLPMRAGRIDATEAGPAGVPEPQEDLAALTDKFARQGFNRSDMIGLVACGHTLGGVHGGDFPTIVPGSGTAGNNFSHFDSTVKFDNLIATEYINGNTSNPLVVGADSERNSDLRVFSADGNVTMRSLTNPTVFKNRCASLLTRMIETVPAGTVLTEPLQAYDIKPGLLNLELSADGSNITFTGNIRVRVTDRPASEISSVQLLYLGRNGTTGSISTKPATFQGGTGFGLVERFMHYEISSVLSATTSISSFNVTVTLINGNIETYNNNGVGYPVSSTIMLSNKRSCLRTNTPFAMTVSAAVRGTFAPDQVQLVYSVPVDRQGSIVPLIQTLNTTMSLNSTVGDYSIYSVDVPLISGQGIRATFDLVAGAGESQKIDYFRNTGSFAECK